MGEIRKHLNGDLIQILFNIVIIGVFSIIEKWLLFSYGSWGLAVVFGILIVLMCCLLAINMYSCLLGLNGKKKKDKEKEQQVYALLYKQMKKMESQIPGMVYQGITKVLSEQQKEINKQIEDLKLNQLRSAKAVLSKVEQIQKMQEELQELLKQAAVESTAEQETEPEPVKAVENPVEALLSGNDDPNRELSPDEIAALFAGVNN